VGVMGWNRIEWGVFERSGVDWGGFERSGVEWNGVDFCVWVNKMEKFSKITIFD